MTIRIDLRPAMFGEREHVLATAPGFECSTFRFDSGVEGLRLRNERGHIVVLPFRGQQIWRATFDGRELAMRSLFDEPARSTDYLRTYGAFFLHCGVTGMGAPGPHDTHPLHGELPNAAFARATLVIDEADGSLCIQSVYRHAVAFSTDYLATARTAMRRDSALLDVSLEVHNRKRGAMDLLYLGHSNFRPIDGARLVYSAPYTPEAVRVRRSVPSHIKPQPGYAELLEALAARPEAHHRLEAGAAYDPEVVFAIDMVADAEGWAHALQVHPDGRADYAAHRPQQAPIASRWLCRTPEQDAIGLSMPATSGVEGYSAEKAHGRVVDLAGGATWRIDMRLGALTAPEAARMERHIDQCLDRA